MTKLLEKISLLGLSLLLISAFSISTALPDFLSYYQGYAAAQVELLVSVPSFSVVAMLLLNPIVDKWLSDKQLIVIGLLLLSTAGIFPFFNQSYVLVLVSRILFGVGIGLINAKAIAIISQRFRGKERVQMLGLRASAELVGGAICSLLVGQLMRIDWTWSFLIYGLGFVILAFYLLFVPDQEENREERKASDVERSLTAQELKMIVGMALLAGFVICINSSINLRLPLFESAGGRISSSQSALALSLEQAIGIVAGLSFSPLLGRFKEGLLQVALLCLSLCLLGMSVAPNLYILIPSAVGVGFFYSIILINIFNTLSDKIPLHTLNKATAYVLLGCNLGSALSPYILRILGLISNRFGWFFLAYALISLVLFVLLVVRSRLWKKQV